MEREREVVIITGSSGFIGSSLIKQLKNNFSLIGFDKISSRVPPVEAECVCIDLTSEDAIKKAFDRVRIAYGERIASVIHLAAYYDLTGEPSPLYEEITVQGTKMLLKHLQKFKVEQFIFTSTMLVHAPTKPNHPINEESPLDPRWPYPMSKVETEALIRKQHGNIPIVILRLAGVYNDMLHNPFLAQQISRIYENQILSHFYPGDIHHGQSFIHLKDACQAFNQLIYKRKELPSELVLLLGEPETMSYDELQQTIAQLLVNKHWLTTEIPKNMAKTGAWIEDKVLEEEPFIKPWMVDFADDHYELDIAKARDVLDWQPKHSLRDTLPTIISNLKENPKKWYQENKLNSALVALDSKSATSSSSSAKKSEAERFTEKLHSSRENENMLAQMHRKTLWVHFVNIGLGAWLIASAFVFGLLDTTRVFSSSVLQVTAERGLFSPIYRDMAAGINDIASGFLIMLFGILSLRRKTNLAQWMNTFVGLWLLFASLIFWTPNAGAYNNDLIVGMLVIGLSILVPMMPGMSMEGMMDSKAIPPGWTYSPSTWTQRLPMIVLSLIGFLIARHLTAYQLGHVDAVWEPFFPGKGELNGTETIITSDVSKAWPIPDAGLGAVSYAIEILMACMGSKTRWRTMPWMVTFFVILVAPLGVVSIYFIVIQPIVIGTWCTLCLIAALAMLLMIPFAIDEIIAMGQFLLWSKRQGKPFWRTFFKGGAMEGGSEMTADTLTSPQSALKDMDLGLTYPWTLNASIVIGLLLMFTRLIFGTSETMADSDHLVGSLIITVSVIAWAEVVRPLRFVNVFFGAWLIIAPWLLSGSSLLASCFGVVFGIMLIALSLPRGRHSQEHYGGWDKYIV